MGRIWKRPVLENSKYHLGVCLLTLRKAAKINSDRITCVLTDIRMKPLPNMGLECYRYANPPNRSPSSPTMALGSTQSLIEMSTRNLPEG
jgi:hypothetical protein